MAQVEFEDNSIEVKDAIEEACIAWLYEAAGELESQTKRNTPVDTGQLKGSWQYKVNENEKKATIGSSLENAIWNELGTGQYALNGDGRNTPWAYKDVKGKWHFTHGKRPRRSLHKAYHFLQKKIIANFQEKMKELD